ncbi:TFIIB-type zinc ribbon-containing protein [Natronomonas sp. F2-12]|jgi:uncharacterized Zn finger protein (UPF0148 family)|uniref:TFIIB-type zinc ribbon-containing protein n=1 Tax=Natronomonas aquatica TaxID=2841590 RepID=A0A9R1CRG4_9EURY|nr:TFIIB-type zinc ribbon-containing protein [Natronomonas aquatica]MCQ4332463.1 TFIIB-type zinc ribbon-containing protein [Natronomonas aquatica]
MKIRGRRECKACGKRWSYYETGSVSCPACGGIESVGTEDERSLHTATAATLDLTPVRRSVGSEPLRRLAERANDRARAFTRGYGFIDAGEFSEFDGTYLAAMELRSVAGELARRMETDDDEELYFTALLRADEGDRPSPEEVPDSMCGMRGLAYANAVGEYRSDLRRYLREHPDPSVDGPLERLASHVKRIRALQGDVDPSESERLVTAARAVGRYVSGNEGGALVRAEELIDTLG